MSTNASELGKLARGKPKNYTPEELRKRAHRLAAYHHAQRAREALERIAGASFGDRVPAPEQVKALRQIASDCLTAIAPETTTTTTNNQE